MNPELNWIALLNLESISVTAATFGCYMVIIAILGLIAAKGKGNSSYNGTPFLVRDPALTATMTVGLLVGVWLTVSGQFSGGGNSHAHSAGSHKLAHKPLDIGHEVKELGHHPWVVEASLAAKQVKDAIASAALAIKPQTIAHSRQRASLIALSTAKKHNISRTAAKEHASSLLAMSTDPAKKKAPAPNSIAQLTPTHLALSTLAHAPQSRAIRIAIPAVSAVAAGPAKPDSTLVALLAPVHTAPSQMMQAAASPKTHIAPLAPKQAPPATINNAVPESQVQGAQHVVIVAHSIGRAPTTSRPALEHPATTPSVVASPAPPLTSDSTISIALSAAMLLLVVKIATETLSHPQSTELAEHVMVAVPVQTKNMRTKESFVPSGTTNYICLRRLLMYGRGPPTLVA